MIREDSSFNENGRLIGLAAGLLVMAAGAAVGAQSSGGDLSAYASCKFSDGLQSVQTDLLPSGTTTREVDTDDGSRLIEMEAGERIMFAYPNTDFYANVKAERLPRVKFGELKGYLLDNLNHLAHDNPVNKEVQSPLHGFEVHGLDRNKLEGGVLGIYLLFHAVDQTVTTIYFLNQEPQSRKFQSMDEYRTLRDRFLEKYTACIQENLK